MVDTVIPKQLEAELPGEELTTSSLDISQTQLEPYPQMDLVVARAKEITAELGMVIEPLYDGYATMAAYLYTDPNIDVNRLVDATVFFNILFYVDEMFGEDTSGGNAPDLKAIMPILMATTDISGNYPAGSALSTLAKGIFTLKQIISKPGMEFAIKMSNTLFLHLDHSLHPRDFSNVQQYIDTRLEFSGMYLATDMIEFVYNIKLTPEIETAVSLLGPARTSVAEIGALSNDIISYPKETQSRFNLINVLKTADTDAATTKAIHEAINLTNEKYQDFLGIVDACKMQAEKKDKDENPVLTEDQKAVVYEYLHRLSDVVSASYHWQVNTLRYMHENHFFSDLKMRQTH